MFDLEPVYIFSYFSMKFYVTGTHQKCLTEALLTEYQQLIFQGGNIQNINTFWLKKKNAISVALYFFFLIRRKQFINNNAGNFIL